MKLLNESCGSLNSMLDADADADAAEQARQSLPMNLDPVRQPSSIFPSMVRAVIRLKPTFQTYSTVPYHQRLSRLCCTYCVEPLFFIIS